MHVNDVSLSTWTQLRGRPPLCRTLAVVLICGSKTALAAEDSIETTVPVAGLQLVDWVIIGVYAFSTVAIGWWFGRNQKDTRSYFVGSGKMSPMLIGVSLFATLLSTISYMSFPGEVLGKGPVYMSNYLAYPVIYLIAAFWLLPAYMNQRVTSAYELLEARLGVSVRMLGATLFLILRLFWMSLLVYLTSKALAIMMGLDERYIPWIVAITGAFAITYTSLGGLRAVVITDFMQTILLLGGAVLVIGTVTVEMNGFGWFPTEWQHEIWDAQPVWSFDPSTRVTVVGSMLSVAIWYICTLGGDQVSVQRFMATEDLPAARRAVAMQLIVAAVVGVMLALVGVALLGYFQANPGAIPESMLLKRDADKIFPHFIAYHLPPVVSGLVVAGLFAAAMSSIDSGVNSITAVVMTDFLDRFGLEPSSDRSHVIYAKVLAVGTGVIVIGLSTVIQHVPGNITAVTNKTINLLSVPIFLLFYFALFVPRATTIGVWIGVIGSTVVAVLISFSGYFFGMNEQGIDPVSFQWISPSSLVVGIALGKAASWLTRDTQR